MVFLRPIHQVETQIDAAAMWYAEYRFPLTPKGTSWKSVQTTQRQRFKRALPKMRDFERMALGGAYLEAFSRPSATIHSRPAALTPSLPIR